MISRIFFSLFLILAVIFINGLIYEPVSAQLMMPMGDNSGVEAAVNAYFANAPEMVAIAKCESGFRQFGAGGMPLRGGGSGAYIGIFQISEGHAQDAQSLGMDIYFVDGNLAYAKYMYDRQGTRPWSGCVSSPAAASVPANPTASSSVSQPVAAVALTSNLNMGMVSDQVVVLQKLLNAAGFTLSASGPGSPGNETSRFGALTREAVKKFQCSKNIACGGAESTTGYGRVGPQTRAALLALANKL